MKNSPSLLCSYTPLQTKDCGPKTMQIPEDPSPRKTAHWAGQCSGLTVYQGCSWRLLIA
jgi:hypothetical protein